MAKRKGPWTQFYSWKQQEKGLLSESHETTNGQDTAMLLGFFRDGKLRAQELDLRDVFNFLQEINLNR